VRPPTEYAPDGFQTVPEAPLPTEKTALVVVHGVADQLPGATARSIVDLLVASSPATAAYRSVGSRDLTLAVPPLAPCFAAPRKGEPTPQSTDRSLFKAFLQSYRSDFQRHRWEAPTAKEVLAGMKAAKTAPSPPAAPGPTAQSLPGPAADATVLAAAVHASGPAGPDRGLAFTDYLLGKQLANGGLQEAWDTTCLELERSAAGRTERIDVYEMYWADLSRLSGAIPRILTEFGTLIFRLSRLGRDTVDEGRAYLRGQRGATPAWTLLSALQAAIDWLFVNVLAQLFFHLFLFGGVLVLLGLARPVVPEHRLHLGVAIVLALLGVLLLLYRRGGRWRTKALPLAMLALAAASLLVAGAEVAVTGIVLLVLVSAAYDAALRVADERFPFVRHVGLVLWTVLLAFVLVHRYGSLGGTGTSLDAWRGAALYGSELALVAIKWFWVAMAPLLLAWVLTGLYVQYSERRPRGYEGGASIATGRLGIGVSLCAFVVMTMALWALLRNLLDLALKGVGYLPEIFSAPVPGTGQSSAQAYLQERYLGTTETFAPLAILLLTLLAFAIVTLFPSVLAELTVMRDHERLAGAAGGPPADRAAQRQRHFVTAALRLGRWLTGGYRLADLLMLLICIAGVLVSIAVMYVFARLPLPSFLQDLFEQSRATLAELSRVWLAPLVFSAAGLVAALSLLGGVLSRYAPAVRAPLDVALDVDNYFREFPRKKIPRARIFARYVALLEHVAAQGPERIVIVAHSQGCVISVETLRWLREARRMGKAETPARARLFERLGGDLRLLTAGCPLRQLYAARFPTLYRWVLRKDGVFCGPRAEDVGVRQWLNAFTSGDYVGRWLWSRDGPNDDLLGHPLTEVLQPGVLGRASVYDAFAPTPPDGGELDAASEAETCLGVGAHTHYFEPDQKEMAWLVDYLLGSRYTVTGSSGNSGVGAG
jgi:hypothetical protein